MVKLVNWRRATLTEQKLNITSILKRTSADIVIIPLSHSKLVEYIKSTDLDTMEPLIIRLEKKGKLTRELNKLKREGFEVKVVLPNLDN
ncbi:MULTISPECIES: hypothetical protein [Metallosphaera]|uniref:Uncharacterized protein n=3 Tax=Metallosphaera TaxID=41980 RepID=A4YH46_METS5|nr:MULTISPECIES: hypothetical protein [Metallosphaera]ABP95748.1 hypothetical protein Msed_1593 [Metallosphaera sedula DSM 5348]AIM27732.1 hypothetical protein HA72_1593 [Metallosphaera sedula]AKV74589.1 hypothetical protein MsedA_1618 [Metallosphaera sedula]AKV76828.1 hypothetical protein MsedB_1620 [Metallosphaera sedula]AKV79079.1 hypothetical protein MsedC_1618 [Metallosphaera sedula]